MVKMKTLHKRRKRRTQKGGGGRVHKKTAGRTGSIRSKKMQSLHAGLTRANVNHNVKTPTV